MEEEIKRKKKQPDPEKILSRLAGLCARSEQCSYDLLKKMNTAGLSREEADNILSRLISLKFVDDFRYARSLARDKVRFSGWGVNKIKAYLFTKHLSESIISQAIGAIESQDYKDALIRVARAKAKSLDLHSDTVREKLIRHIASRGFELKYAIRITDLILERAKR